MIHIYESQWRCFSLPFQLFLLFQLFQIYSKLIHCSKLVHLKNWSNVIFIVLKLKSIFILLFFIFNKIFWKNYMFVHLQNGLVWIAVAHHIKSNRVVEIF